MFTNPIQSKTDGPLCVQVCQFLPSANTRAPGSQSKIHLPGPIQSKTDGPRRVQVCQFLPLANTRAPGSQSKTDLPGLIQPMQNPFARTDSIQDRWSPACAGLPAVSYTHLTLPTKRIV